MRFLSRLRLRLEVAAARAWRFLVGALALWGAAWVIAPLYFYVVLPRLEAWEDSRPVCQAREAQKSSDVAKRLARKIGPELQAVATEYKPLFVGHAGNALERAGARLAYPLVVREIPPATEIGCDRLLSFFGRMSLGELVEMVVDHAAAKGEPVHETLLFHERGAAPGSAR